ncbi:hypothetical protein LAZ67_8002909 [Cordylochernes scorpioides]|uniref:RNA-directed DNA polymerase n=1 Tax=Cordylochernes scorpioides TaxID=51811 RepID=A0ABY6KWB7_9ARAC|nr:hypothetical protein LAZ67_8002909 [Cordylochernes scorpioides]
MLQLPLKRLRFNQISPFASNNKKPRNDIATERLSRQDSEMELNQDPISVKSDGPTETMERRQEVRGSEPAGGRQEMTGRETTAPLADAVNQLSTFLTRVKISDGAESAISPFDGTYSAAQFFQTFDRKMEDASMEEQEKLLRLPNYLVRQPLELFRKLRLADRSYFQVRQTLLDLYPESSEASFAKYFAMKLTGQANLETYYREKTAMGLQLGLPQEVILETLTEGLPFNDQRLVRVVPPENLGEWFRLKINHPQCRVRTTAHPDAQVHGMHLLRRPTASSAARDTGTANADVDQSRRPTKKSGQCKRSQNHQFRLHHNQVKPETPQPGSPFETEVGSLNQLTVKLYLAPNVSCPFLIDTGASLSIVPYNIYHMLKTHLPNLTLEGHSLHLQTLNGFAKTMGKLSIPLTIGQISRKEYFHVVNAPLPFGILSINSLHKFRLTIDFNKCTILQLGAPLSTLSYHFNHVSNVCTYWQCQAISQKIFPTSQLSAYDNHCVHSLRKPHLSTCPFFTKANCPFYMPSNNQTTTTSTYEPVQNAPTQRDNSHTKNIGDHTPLHNSHMTNPHNELDTHTNTQQNPLPHAYYNTTPNTHYTPQFTTLLQRYTHIFSQDKFNVPCLRIPPVKIPTNSEKIITIRPYRVPICDQQEIRNQIQQMLENGIIEQSFSPFSSPVTLVTKRDKTKRFCIDYRKVNELISSDVHPLPRIEDILDHLAQAKYFSTADISSAYWQVPIHPDSRPLLAFATFEGLYQPTRLPFGLKTSPQIYERAISQVLQRHGLDCVAHYFDDFIIYSNTLEEHQNHLRQFFAFCEAEKLQLNFAKCEFFKQSINFLGYTITAGTITPLTRNTDIIHAIKQPHNRKTLQSFLGAVNVYNKFIPEYARLRAPLNNLLKKDVVWNWNEACQEAFIDLKGNLTQHPILHLYKEGLPCQVYCDASTLGIAGILKQVHPDGNVYPVQYFSRTLRPHEKNYSISELECLAIVESVEKFRIYLMGRKFTIFSDHHALQWLKTIKNPSGRLFRWSLRLSSYEYEVRYIKGKLQYEADLLSRNPFCGFLDATLIKTHQPPPSKESSLTIDHNGLHTVSRKGVTKIILPKPLIQQLLQTVHTQYNHPGISQMSRIISTQYYWQGMSKDIKQKVKTCPTCQLTKRPVGPTYGELSQPPESKEPFDLLSLDTIAGFAKYGNTKIYLHVVVDHFSRYAWAFPSKSTSTTTYQQVLKRVFQDGSPKRLLTDRAPAFTSPKFRSFLLNRNIHPLLTTSNNPQANGLCERLNATLTGKLRLLHLENPKVAWTKLVKKVTLIYNKTPHSTTGFPPIYLMFGILPPEISNHNTPYPDIDKARKIAHTRTQNKHLQDKNTYDQRHKQPHFEVGDLVLVKLYHHPNTGKLAPYFTGPHTILEIISPNVVRINRPNQPLQRDTDTIHVNKLKLYTEKIRYISPPAVSTYHIKHNPNYTFPFKHLTPELFPTESLRFKPTSSEPFRHLDPAIFTTRRFTSLFPDVKNCKPDNQLNHITPPPKDIKQENGEPTNHSNSTINKGCEDYLAIQKELPGIIRTTTDQLIQNDQMKITDSTHFAHYKFLSESFMTEEYLRLNISLPNKRLVAQHRVLWQFFREERKDFWKENGRNCLLCMDLMDDNLVHYFFQCPLLTEKRTQIFPSPTSGQFRYHRICQLLSSALNDELLIVRYFKFCTEAGRMRKNAGQRILEDKLSVNRLSLTFTTIKLIMEYFIRLQEMEENRLPKLCWNRLKEISLMTKKPIGFCKNIMDIINHCGLTRLNLRLNYDDIQIELPNILKIKIEQLLQQDLAKLSLTKTYLNYRLLYDSFIPEDYFSCNLSSALVSFIAQIRIISTLIKENHIYVIKKEDLYCKLCGGQITDEIYHFTAECGDLEGERKKILKSLPRPHLNSLKTIKTVSDKKSWAIELFNYQKSVVNKIALVEERRTGAQ